MQSSDAVKILRRWGDFGRQYAAPISFSWSSVDVMIHAAREFQQFEAQHLNRLLEGSDSLLRPLEDPFRVDFGVHRWLRDSREEVYSDWLEWIVRHLATGRDDFSFFGLAAPSNSAEWMAPDIDRELPVPEGRLDLAIRYPNKALLIIEVKVTREEYAETKKQEIYKQWIATEPEMNKRGVLIAIDPSQGESDGDFVRLGWREVSIKVRRLAVRTIRDGHPVVAAMMLAFAGAVEQNLLHMPGLPLVLINRGALIDTLLIRGYLSEFCENLMP
jgi:hypothetical protein